LIKPDIIAAFQCIYNQTTGPLPRLNGAMLTLLPKEVSESAGDFRPISLIRSFVSKVLALRLAPHIDGLVSQAHSALCLHQTSEHTG
jgi:hypothetical protein